MDRWPYALLDGECSLHERPCLCLTGYVFAVGLAICHWFVPAARDLGASTPTLVSGSCRTRHDKEWTVLAHRIGLVDGDAPSPVLWPVGSLLIP